jgi:hypothetical protein
MIIRGLEAHYESMEWMPLYADASHSLLFFVNPLIYMLLLSRSGKQCDKTRRSTFFKSRKDKIADVLIRSFFSGHRFAACFPINQKVRLKIGSFARLHLNSILIF